ATSGWSLTLRTRLGRATKRPESTQSGSSASEQNPFRPYENSLHQRRCALGCSDRQKVRVTGRGVCRPTAAVITPQKEISSGEHANEAPFDSIPFSALRSERGASPRQRQA